MLPSEQHAKGRRACKDFWLALMGSRWDLLHFTASCKVKSDLTPPAEYAAWNSDQRNKVSWWQKTLATTSCSPVNLHSPTNFALKKYFAMFQKCNENTFQRLDGKLCAFIQEGSNETVEHNMIICSHYSLTHTHLCSSPLPLNFKETSFNMFCYPYKGQISLITSYICKTDFKAQLHTEQSYKPYEHFIFIQPTYLASQFIGHLLNYAPRKFKLLRNTAHNINELLKHTKGKFFSWW